MTPDQPSNPSGAPMLTAQWKTTIKWKEDPTGKRVVDKPAVIVQKVIDEVSSTNATSMTSTFLNPVVEQEAVTRAIDIAKAQCKWTQWQDGANWKDLLNLTIIVPPPRTAKGYGLAVERGEGFAKKSAAAAAGFIKDFETGKIKTIDELMKKLDVQLVPDATGEGAAVMPHAVVVLTRGNTGAPWTSKTHYPTPKPTGWECAQNKPLTGKMVRGPGPGAPVVAPDYTP